jgi:hypothetical protein
LTCWVWRIRCSVIAEGCRCRRGRRRSERELFSVSWCLRERLAPQAMWWKHRGDYAAFSRFSAQKWIHHPDSIVNLAVVQVLGIKCGLTQFQSARNNRGSNLSL